MTKEVEPSVKDDVAAVRLAMGYAAKGTVSSGGSVRPNGLAAFDRILQQLQEAEERWNSHSCTQKLQGLELVQARSERDAAIERANEAERIGAEDEESLIRSRNEADRLAAELRQAIERAEKLEAALHSIAEPGSVALDTIEDDGLIVTTQELQRCKRVARNALSTPETGETDG